MLRDRDNKFWKMWRAWGWQGRKKGAPACWGHSMSQNARFFERMDSASHCGQPWGSTLKAPAVLGFAETMARYCAQHGRRLEGVEAELISGGTSGTGKVNVTRASRVLGEAELISACRGANLNILRIGGWNMCKNLEWIYCAARGKLADGGQDSGGVLIFSLAPNSLDLAPFYVRGGTGAYQGDGYYSENDIYYLELCVLNEICANRDELFSLDVGDHFRCQYDAQGHAAMRDEGLLRWEAEYGPKRCTSWECQPYNGVS